MNKEITWNIVNSLLAGALVFLGGCAAGEITWKVIGASAIAALIVAITKFKQYWENEQNEYSEENSEKNKKGMLFSFF